MAGDIQTVAKVELHGDNGDQIRYTVADGTQISKGVLLKLTDPRTAILYDVLTTSGAVQAAGIAAHDKEASDGSTSISVWTNGVFDMVASGAITVGNPVVFLGHNKIGEYYFAGTQNPASFGVVVGRALETAAHDERINVKVKIP